MDLQRRDTHALVGCGRFRGVVPAISEMARARSGAPGHSFTDSSSDCGKACKHGPDLPRLVVCQHVGVKRNDARRQRLQSGRRSIGASVACSFRRCPCRSLASMSSRSVAGTYIKGGRPVRCRPSQQHPPATVTKLW